ncbi:ABC-type branched-chain amino acid transport systems, ATPase component [Desulfosporosinus orientis DSM 765]|uniref:ABC-type branched-chain amino acid transport systems, ATPase component n=1 Tax=Desulfosporosinus orientis (strain ATCC 19365 / DSM 765 / NCIMB 8382 / VKM B-1628 / Singapore I) TaxID=768706 RepID=G7W827_DESOD|nr:ABC transporter ATP-binding protein [Desulfosporosinus orientis]AET66453.1 ABC-type branched-chain amino acid transport systems, ATPase component [Desulfosporosinus orientis DSM 765]
MLQVERLKKAFDGFQAISDANLSVPQGEVVAVIGPNGAGKSTLFNLISGHLQADSGHIRFLNEDITNLAPYKICHKGMARSFQLINIFTSLTVFENVQTAVIAKHRLDQKFFKPSKRLVVEETLDVLESLGLLEYKDRSCSSLSYGDQKVLEIAIAVGSKPTLLLLDEPTAGMSSEETQRIVNLIKHLSREKGLSILITEHDMDLVFDVAQKIMVLHQGKTIAQGLPQDIRNDKSVQNAYLGETG